MISCLLITIITFASKFTNTIFLAAGTLFYAIAPFEVGFTIDIAPIHFPVPPPIESEFIHSQMIEGFPK